jgi:nitroreductase
MDILTQHVSIRRFDSRPVSEELLSRILSAGIRASTTGNMQWYSIVVTRTKEMIGKMAPLHFNQPVAKNAPAILTFCADINRFTLWCRQNHAVPGYDNFLSFFTAAIDALLVAQNVCVAAENAGLGICYLGTVTYNAAEIIELLGLPQLVVPVAAVALGWPGESPVQQDRLPLQAVIHHEKYRNYTGDDIDKYYSMKESLESSKMYVAENNKDTLAQVFTDMRYKKGDNEFFSLKFLEVLKRQGFLLPLLDSLP